MPPFPERGEHIERVCRRCHHRKKLLELPLAGRSSYDLVRTQPGVVQGLGTNGSFNINGNRGGAVNFTTDGINSQDNLLPGSFISAAIW